ncbi:hypothetical protein Hanom_Chr12g01151631 [Helianthus anomalus]
MKYDFRRGCFLDENLNPADMVKIFLAGTYKTKTKDMSKNEEFKKDETSKCEVVCSKCDKFEANNVKLLKDVESLILENKNF